MTSVAKSTPTLAALWKQTEGTPEQRTKALLRLAEGVPAIAGNALLKQIHDLAADGTFEQVTKIFDAPARANRKHDVKADGMRAGTVASLHQTTLAAGPVAAKDMRSEPAELSEFSMFAIGGTLSEAQRDWCVSTLRGENVPFPPPVPARDAFTVKMTAIDLEPVLTSSERPEVAALMRCAIANLACPQTQTTIKNTLDDGDLNARTSILRATQVIDALKDRTNAAPLAALPTQEWRTAIRKSNSGELADNAARDAYEAGDIEQASLLLRLAVKFGRFVADEAHLVGAAHFIKSGAFHEAADELKQLPREPLLEKTIALLQQANPAFSAAHLKELDDSFPMLSETVRDSGKAEKSGDIPLRKPAALDVDALIKRGSAAAPKASLGDAAMEQAMGDLRLALASRGNPHGMASAAMDISTSARLAAYGLDSTIDFAMCVLKGRGASLIRRIDSVEPGPSIWLQQRTIDVGRDVSNTMAGEHTFYLLGHTAETSDTALKQAAITFRERRSGGIEQVETTSGETRQMHVGSFFKPSVGHIHSGDNTEVFSTGFQAFANPRAMVDFYRRDPEHFALILGYLLT